MEPRPRPLRSSSRREKLLVVMLAIASVIAHHAIAAALAHIPLWLWISINGLPSTS
jgi:hypothetical protein